MKTADDRVSDALDRQANRIAELEQQNRALSTEVQQLRDREGRTIRTETERNKLAKMIRAEKSIEAVRQLLRTPYVEGQLPVVHRIIQRLRDGTAPKDAADWIDLQVARDELAAAKTERVASAEAIRDSLATVVRASQLDRQEWLDNCSDDLRALWHLRAVQA